MDPWNPSTRAALLLSGFLALRALLRLLDLFLRLTRNFNNNFGFGFGFGFGGGGGRLGVGRLGASVLLQHLEVGLKGLARCLLLLDLESDAPALPVDPLGRDEPLDLGGPGLVAALNLAADDELADVVTRAEVKEPADLGGPLRSESARSVLVGESRDFLLTLLDHHQVEDGEVGGGDTATDGLAAHFTRSARAVALHPLFEEESHTVGGEDTLHHGKSLLVVATRYLENVALELVSERIAGNLRAHALFEKGQEPFFVVDLHGLLHTRVRHFLPDRVLSSGLDIARALAGLVALVLRSALAVVAARAVFTAVAGGRDSLFILFALFGIFGLFTLLVIFGLFGLFGLLGIRTFLQEALRSAIAGRFAAALLALAFCSALTQVVAITLVTFTVILGATLRLVVVIAIVAKLVLVVARQLAVYVLKPSLEVAEAAGSHAGEPEVGHVEVVVPRGLVILRVGVDPVVPVDLHPVLLAVGVEGGPLLLLDLGELEPEEAVVAGNALRLLDGLVEVHGALVVVAVLLASDGEGVVLEVDNRVLRLREFHGQENRVLRLGPENVGRKPARGMRCDAGATHVILSFLLREYWKVCTLGGACPAEGQSYQVTKFQRSYR
ncbi:small subunit ribosomal protein S6e [Babesia caballi]|uniref:Small subunit ribosomal protein S6e n=1 Tax=Babesia caballi TaxID=5871 RepID=A0AAV4LLZ9_BABCB|nr:small subunit ribosomal protein S6e [Babesia caballi]